ncbi:FRG domain [Mycobacteroides abscessus subsp. massiliense]|nr:FRG domain [Mycobacteroides abscessus subsp. massiliense]
MTATYQRVRRSAYTDGRASFPDVATDLGWYDHHEISGGRVVLERFGTIPAPQTLHAFIQTAQEIASAANGAIFGWRGQSRDWPVHSGSIRRVMQPWIRRFPSDLQRIDELLRPILVEAGVGQQSIGKEVARQDDDPMLWWNMRTYQQYLLNEARVRGFDHHEGVKLSDLEILALLQHYGAATHLLDVSRDVMTALWFAAQADPGQTGVMTAFDESGILTLTANQAAVTSFDDLMHRLTYEERWQVAGWVPRSLTPRILAQRGLFVLSGYADQPWGSIATTSTYAWEDDVETKKIQPSDARAFFIAITPDLKRQVLEAGESGLLGVDPTSLFPDMAGFAAANGSSEPIPLLP